MALSVPILDNMWYVKPKSFRMEITQFENLHLSGYTYRVSGSKITARTSSGCRTTSGEHVQQYIEGRSLWDKIRALSLSLSCVTIVA